MITRANMPADNVEAGIDYERLASMIADRVAIKLRAQPKFVTRKQLAKATSLGLRTIDRWKAAGMIPFEQFGNSVRFPFEATMQAIAKIKDQAS